MSEEKVSGVELSKSMLKMVKDGLISPRDACSACLQTYAWLSIYAEISLELAQSMSAECIKLSYLIDKDFKKNERNN